MDDRKTRQDLIKELKALRRQIALLEKSEGERKQVEEALRASEERYRKLYNESKRSEDVYRSLLHSSADAIVIYDLEGRPEYISPAFTKIFGWTMEDLKGKRIPFLPDSEKVNTMAIIRDLIENGNPCHGFETKRTTKEGQLLDVSISASRYNNHEGRPAGMLVVLRDISERKRMEAQFQATQRMESLGTIAGGVAHDFNNLLMGIQGNAALMSLHIDARNPHYERLRNIEQLVKSGAELTKQLLGFARGGKYEVRATDLNELIGKSSRMFGRTKKEIEIHEKYDKVLWPVEVDQGQIEQVLLNLCLNAWQAMPGGGKLFLETENVTLGRNRVKPYGLKPGKYVKVSIRDTGLGMNERTRQRIFDPFFTTKEMGRGAGLGLASVYGIVKNHHGIIDVFSEENKGTRFCIYLPASKKEVKTETEPPEAVLKGQGTVLFVDDEDIILDVGVEVLRSLGYHVLVARGGREAIQVYAKNREEIDVVILDMVMPDIGGGEAFDRMKEIDPNIKVLLSSGYDVDGQAKKILERGCEGFIQKPFDLKMLSLKIREILNTNIQANA